MTNFSAFSYRTWLRSVWLSYQPPICCYRRTWKTVADTSHNIQFEISGKKKQISSVTLGRLKTLKNLIAMTSNKKKHCNHRKGQMVAPMTNQQPSSSPAIRSILRSAPLFATPSIRIHSSDRMLIWPINHDSRAAICMACHPHIAKIIVHAYTNDQRQAVALIRRHNSTQYSTQTHGTPSNKHTQPKTVVEQRRKKKTISNEKIVRFERNKQTVEQCRSSVQLLARFWVEALEKNIQQQEAVRNTLNKLACGFLATTQSILFLYISSAFYI